MITPTRTVCYVRMLDGSLKEFSEARSLAHLWGWDFTKVERVVVREESVKIEEGPTHPFCNKTFNPINPCDCGDCDSVLSSYSFMRPIPMPHHNYQKMYQGEWHDEK
jgi:hypothetical protein